MSDYLLTTKSLFQKKRFIVFVLISLLFFQLIYSFLFPSTGTGGNFLPPTAYIPKFEVENTDNLLLEKVSPFLSSDYRLHADSGSYLELARNFNPEYFKDHAFLNRPLYPFLIFLTSLPSRLFASPSYGIFFCLAILLNFILIALTVFLLFWLLEKLFSLKVAFLSSVLLIFSPYVHVSIIQPMAEMLMAFAVALSVFLLYNYIKNPSALKLIAFSLIVGVFMLGKMFYAIPFFILLLAIYFKRYKEGAAFLLVHLIPLGFWYLWVTQVWQIPYYLHEAQHWGMGVWLFGIFQWPWHESLKVLLAAFPNFIKSLSYGFVLVPLLFSVIGFHSWRFKSKNIFYLGPIISLFAFFFIINLYPYRFSFLLFPIIYPTCILGIELVANSLRKYASWYRPVFWALAFGLIIALSNIDIYKVFYWLEAEL